MYYYSSYFQNWSRVLLNNFYGEYIEIDLTGMDSDWERVKKQIIRTHRTARRPSDKLVMVLPADVEKQMQENLGHELTRRLLTFDYLPNIDWVKYRKMSNGGSPYLQVKLPGALS